MIREAKSEDLNGLLRLYTFLKNEEEVPEENAYCAWNKIIENKDYHIIVEEINDVIVSSCTLVILPNLTHSVRPYALIENVVTDESFRGKGAATRCLNFAKELAKKENCYKIMLMTGSKDNGTLSFYERAGYNRHDKTAFIMWL